MDSRSAHALNPGDHPLATARCERVFRLVVCLAVAGFSSGAALSRGAEVVVPPTKNAAITGRQCPVRDVTIRHVHDVGRRQWKTEAGYHRQWKAENTFFRYNTIIADRLRARGRDAQRVEARLACNILNCMSELGMPASAAIDT